MKRSDIFWQTYLNLEKEAIELSKYVFFTDEVLEKSNGNVCSRPCNTQLETFSPYIADLLVRCCVQIEAISKELYFDIDGSKKRGDSNIFFDEDCLKKIDSTWKTHNKIVMVVAPFFNFVKEENCFLRPLKNAHKRQGTYWEKAYQAVKHDRYLSLKKGNIKAFIRALAALYLLNLYYRNDSWITSYQQISKFDYSMGSAIFAVKPPIAENLWKKNDPTYSESPYVAIYENDGYQRIKEIQHQEEEALKNYCENQPELHEPDFKAYLKKVSKEGKKIIPIFELSKYRLNKNIPNTLPFEERKTRLLNSEEWNCRIHQQNKHLSADELTEDNIQKEIDIVGTNWGIEIMKTLQKLEWLPIALNSEICKICILSETDIDKT